MDVTTNAPDFRWPAWLEPVSWLGQTVVAAVAYFGGIAVLLATAAVSPFRSSRDEDAPGFWHVLKGEVWWLLMMGLPLVGLVHVAMGSFLALQAYFGSTFVDGTGAVVGVGLIRNLATLMTGMTLSGLLAGRIILDFASTATHGREGARRLDDTAERRLHCISEHPTMISTEHGIAAAPRIAAAAVASTLLSLWGVVVGTVVGWQCADTMMGLAYETFFMMFYQMLWFRDVLGILVKGVLFGVFPAAVCCYEGLRLAERWRGAGDVQTSASIANLPKRFGGPIVRAASLSMLSIQVLNMTWFLLMYHAVPVYGPSLLSPPGP